MVLLLLLIGCLVSHLEGTCVSWDGRVFLCSIPFS
ncbi:hypothetical protein GLYMA_08G219750v4 [Glycine max]|nr:hypothetical protein GLYMA_08G219750v4 [Glycine max]KAH1052479.1 hypothetical protein GYH30_022016 [Glycine max]